MARGIFWEKMFYFEKYKSFYSFSDNMQNYSGFLGRTFSQGCQNCIPQFQQNFLRRLYFLRKKLFFFLLRALGENYFGLGAKILCQSCLNCLLGGQRNILMKFSWLEVIFFAIFGHCANMLKIYVYFFLSLRFSYLNAMHPEELFDEDYFLNNFLSFLSLLDIERKSSDLFLFFGEVVRTAFCIYKGTFWARECSQYIFR